MCSRAFQLLIQFLQVWIGGEECRRGKGEGVWEEGGRGNVGGAGEEGVWEEGGRRSVEGGGGVGEEGVWEEWERRSIEGGGGVGERECGRGLAG